MAVFDGNVFDIGAFDVAAGVADGNATGATLTANISLIAGAAQTEAPPSFLIPVIIGAGARLRQPLKPTIHAKALGDLIVCNVKLIPGATFATTSALVVGRSLLRTIEIIPGTPAISIETPSRELVHRCTLTAGQASGFDAIAHDNEFLLLAA